MRLNWIGYFDQTDGYGRFNTRLINALQWLGMDIKVYHIGDFARPSWLFDQMGYDYSRQTILCMPPYMLPKIPGRKWLYTMTEGSRILPDWTEKIAESGVERLMVPCLHNVQAFQDSGVRLPISVVPGGTDPEEFSLITEPKAYRPYTFLTFGDRGFRKGWEETRDAFYLAFGGKTTGNMEARLIIKSLPQKSETLFDLMDKAEEKDTRVIYDQRNVLNMRDLYAQVHCLVQPSRSEGWGMMHREAASCGLPVITQRYSGMDDKHTEQWAMVVDSARDEDIPRKSESALGRWRIASVEDLAQKMKYCFYSPETAAAFGRTASQWIRKNQTWLHSATALVRLLQECRRIELVR